MTVQTSQTEIVCVASNLNPTTARQKASRVEVMNPMQQVMKRLFDVVFSVFIVILTFPLMVIIALLIKLDSPGPVLFKQSRLGQYGRVFTIFKFRSMFMNADEIVPHENAGFYVKRPNDPRVTRVGKWLRRSSLDELPQFFNVLRGDMSVIGPRPEVLWIAEKYEPWQRERLLVPQGITGWWQVTGRAMNPLHENTAYDIHYVRHFSLWFDLKILFLTIGNVLSAKGAF